MVWWPSLKIIQIYTKAVFTVDDLKLVNLTNTFNYNNFFQMLLGHRSCLLCENEFNIKPEVVINKNIETKYYDINGVSVFISYYILENFILLYLRNFESISSFKIY